MTAARPQDRSTQAKYHQADDRKNQTESGTPDIQARD
jgi:hypothetical protein